MKQLIVHWIPAAFCGVISLLALFTSTNPEGGWWKPVFFSFLPLCFFFVGAATSSMQLEIRELRKQLTDLQEKKIV